MLPHHSSTTMHFSSLASSSSSLHVTANHSLTLLCLLILIFLSCFFNICNASCNQQDQDSLLLSSINVVAGPVSPLNWSISADCCTWEGVGCDDNGRVTSLLLPSRGLTGSISSSLANLTYLSQLNLSSNLLYGPLPDGFFMALNQLQIIDLSYNRLSGQLSSSDQLPITTKLFDLSSNQFNGTVQLSFLQQARNLVSFNISKNSFFGSIPSFLCSLAPSISILDFSSNQFTGSVPEDIGNCSNLVTLRSGFNELSGPLPDGIYRMFKLQELSFPVNKLNGTISNDIVNLTELRTLALHANEIKGLIPPDIGALFNLEQLMLHINGFNGTLPQSLMNCTRLVVLNVRVNSLGGDLSMVDFSKLTQLSIIDLGNNFFTGRLPESLFTSKSLSAFRVSSNLLTGDIPLNIGALQSLTFLSLSNNSFTNISRAIMVIKDCRNLSTLVLSKNFHNEPFPGDGLIDSEAFQKVQVFSLGGGNFTGPIPTWVGKLSRIEALDLSQNLLTGSIPGWLGNLPHLFYLDLSQNHLSGNFPDELTRIVRLTTPRAPDKEEEIYFPLPMFVLPDNVSSLQYNQKANLPPAIYLESNHLSGEIPVTIGQLKFIHIIDLSDNNFSGSIPSTLSNLTDLEKLLLSNNNLSGDIPASLGSLHFLSSFSVAYNHLEGQIPRGGQFDTFPASSFEGNTRLCGPVWQSFCMSRVVEAQLQKKKSRKKIIIIGIILGMCLGIGITVFVLAFCLHYKRKILPKSDSVTTVHDTRSFDSTSRTYNEFGRDTTSVVLLFPGTKKGIKNVTMSDILKATNNFNKDNIIGCGGFGMVYKATLKDGSKVAIKKLSGDMGLMEREFKAEVEALSTARHENLVALQGYCFHEGSRLLIYTYMENGSLDYWLHEKADGPSQLEWPIRLKIAQGASCGLAYMHHICEPHIIHRDIKSSNILLDEQFKAYVADFGLARLILPYRTHVTTELVGTLGYIPPEYSQSWMATLRGDIYSFGVVMLELLTGKRPMELFRPRTSGELVAWVQLMRNEGKLDEIFDPLIRGKGFEHEMMIVLEIACKCIHQDPFQRPTIQEVLDWLHEVGCKRRRTQDELHLYA